jgi:hypothetical protein
MIGVNRIFCLDFRVLTMLYKFKSQASADLIMFEEHAKAILEIIGKEPTPKGILLLKDMPQALLALEAATQDKASAHSTSAQDMRSEEEDPKAVSLRQRAAPFKKMIKQCMLEEHPIVWGV